LGCSGEQPLPVFTYVPSAWWRIGDRCRWVGCRAQFGLFLIDFESGSTCFDPFSRRLGRDCGSERNGYDGAAILHGRLAQLARAPALHAGCHRFESCIAHPTPALGRFAKYAEKLTSSCPCTETIHQPWRAHEIRFEMTTDARFLACHSHGTSKPASTATTSRRRSRQDGLARTRPRPSDATWTSRHARSRSRPRSGRNPTRMNICTTRKESR
jgi:hypothetical protein